MSDYYFHIYYYKLVSLHFIYDIYLLNFLHNFDTSSMIHFFHKVQDSQSKIIMNFPSFIFFNLTFIDNFIE